MSQYLLSIIIPHYNAPSLLEKLLDSIYQSVKLPDQIQVIVIDDNSTAEAQVLDAVIERYQSQNVLFLKKGEGKKGPGTSRNMGIERAEGTYLLFADSDDFFVNGWYESVFPFLESKNDIVFFPPDSFSIDGSGNSSRGVWLANLIKEQAVSPSRKNELILRYSKDTSLSTLYRASLVRSNRLRFEEKPIGEDMMFSAYAGHFAENVAFSECPIYTFTDSCGSLTAHMSVEKSRIDFETRLQRTIFLHKVLKDEDLAVLGIDHPGLQAFYHSVAEGWGIECGLRYCRYLKRSGVPLVNWRKIGFGSIINRLITSIKYRLNRNH